MISPRGLRLIHRAAEEREEGRLIEYVSALEQAVSALILGGSARMAKALTHLRDIETYCEPAFTGEEGG